LNHILLIFIYAVEKIWSKCDGLQIWRGFRHECLWSKACMRICKKVC
jgi:hypothetical protein